MTTKDALNSLLEYLYDSHYGYLECAKEVSDINLKVLFEDLAHKRMVMIQDIKSLMPQPADDIKQGGSLTGALHRTYIDFKSFLTNGDKHMIVNEVKRGERFTIDEYEKAINHVPAAVNDLLKRQADEIRHNLSMIDKIAHVVP